MSALLSLLILACPTKGKAFTVAGVDLSTRGAGAEISLVWFDMGWTGVVLGAQQGFDRDDSHVFLGAEAGLLFLGMELGFAWTRTGPRMRTRMMISGVYLTPYVEYQPIQAPWAVGALLKLPIEL